MLENITEQLSQSRTKATFLFHLKKDMNSNGDIIDNLGSNNVLTKKKKKKNIRKTLYRFQSIEKNLITPKKKKRDS